MPKVLADGRIRLVILTSKPANPEAVTTTELAAGIRAEQNVLKSDFRLSATGSDTVDDAVLASDSNAVTYGASNYEGNMTPLRFLDSAGVADPTGDTVWEAMKAKGTNLWIAKLPNKHYTTAIATDDEYSLYEVVTDQPQDPADRGGFIKHVIPLGVQQAWEFKKVVTGA